MAFKKKSSLVRYYFFSIIGYINLGPIHAICFSPLLDTLTLDQYMIFVSEFWYGFSYLALAWYSTLSQPIKCSSVYKLVIREPCV